MGEAIGHYIDLFDKKQSFRLGQYDNPAQLDFLAKQGLVNIIHEPEVRGAIVVYINGTQQASVYEGDTWNNERLEVRHMKNNWFKL